MPQNAKCVMILGPTASGKTSFAVRLARVFRAEIVGADSRQVYRGLDIGSGKDLEEYRAEDGSSVPVHLLDVADPARTVFSLADYLLLANRAIEDISRRGVLPVVCGGTALYLHGLLSAYRLRGGAPSADEREKLRSLSNEELRNILRSLDPDDPVPSEEPDNRTRLIRRIEILRAPDGMTEAEKDCLPRMERSWLILGILRSRDEIRASIEKRLDDRLAHGMLDEARRLHEQGVSWKTLEFFGLEYRYMALHLQGQLTFEAMREELLCRIRQFAKRQDSWFRKLERDGFPVYWIRPGEEAKAFGLVSDHLAGRALPPPEILLSRISYGRKK